MLRMFPRDPPQPEALIHLESIGAPPRNKLTASCRWSVAQASTTSAQGLPSADTLLVVILDQVYSFNPGNDTADSRNYCNCKGLSSIEDEHNLLLA